MECGLLNSSNLLLTFSGYEIISHKIFQLYHYMCCPHLESVIISRLLGRFNIIQDIFISDRKNFEQFMTIVNVNQMTSGHSYEFWDHIMNWANTNAQRCIVVAFLSEYTWANCTALLGPLD